MLVAETFQKIVVIGVGRGCRELLENGRNEEREVVVANYRELPNLGRKKRMVGVAKAQATESSREKAETGGG